MKRCLLLILAAALAIPTAVRGESTTFPSGLVHGPKAAFQISAPSGWVLDTTSGLPQGEPCVLYPRGSSWSGSDAVMYAKIASERFPRRDDFVAWTLAQFKQDDPEFQYRTRDPGETTDGYDYVLLEYARPSYPRFERVAYIQFPDAVAFVVYSATKWDSYLATSRLLEEVLATIRYRPDAIDSPPSKGEK